MIGPQVRAILFSQDGRSREAWVDFPAPEQYVERRVMRRLTQRVLAGSTDLLYAPHVTERRYRLAENFRPTSTRRLAVYEEVAHGSA